MKHIFFKNKKFLFGILLFLIFDPLLNAWLNFWLQKIFNTVQNEVSKNLIIRMITLGFVVWTLKRLCSFTTDVLKANYLCRIKVDLKENMFCSFLKEDDASLLESNSGGEYISIFTNDITILEQRLLHQIFGLLSNSISFVILSTSFFILEKRLAVAILTFGLFAVTIPIIFQKILNDTNMKYSNQLSAFTQKLKEYFAGYTTIKNYSVEQKVFEKFCKTNSKTEEAKFEMDYMLSLANHVGSLLSWFMQLMAIGMGLILVSEGQILLGTVISARSFASDIAEPLQGIIGNMNSIHFVKSITKNMEELSKISACSKEDMLGNGDAEEKNTTELRFEDLIIQKADRAIVNHFSYTFEAGKKYLIIGANGSGKSSIFKALKKRIHSYEGQIFINNQEVSKIKHEELSKKISYLNEEVALFSISIADNISLFENYGRENLEQAILQAHIHLQKERCVIDGGVDISSGEKRKIEIARTLLRSADILIFDEVVSTLDIVSAYEIEKMALELEDKTVIFISHNFSGKLLKQYDEILLMDDGKMIAHGSYDNLIQTNTYFQKLCNIKFGS